MASLQTSVTDSLLLSILIPRVLAVGTMAFDLRVGLYEDPPNPDIIKVIQATSDGFKYLAYLEKGWESQLYRFVTTPLYRKFFETQDTLFNIGQKIVDKKVADLEKFREEDGDDFAENQGKLLR